MKPLYLTQKDIKDAGFFYVWLCGRCGHDNSEQCFENGMLFCCCGCGRKHEYIGPGSSTDSDHTKPNKSIYDYVLTRNW